MSRFNDPGVDGPGDGGGGGYTGRDPTTGQGWVIDATADTITFGIAPATGTNNVVVKEYTAGTLTGTNQFAIGAWCAEYGFPSEVEFFADRLWFAGTPTDPQTIWGTQTGDYSNFGRTVPLVDTDAISITINARQVNAVTDLVPLDAFIVLTKGGQWRMTEDDKGNISPGIGLKPQAFNGTSSIQSMVVGQTAIIVQEQGQRVFDIGYRFESDSYSPQDISIWSDHLVEGHTLLRMEWAPAPYKVIWFVRDDGALLGCTYMPEQEVIGWHRHDTGATGENMDEDADVIEDIVCFPGTTETEVYALVKRTIDGQTKRYIEQMAPAFVEDPADWFYVDSGLTYDGRNTTATTVTLSGGTNWTEDENLTLTASASLFVGTSDEGDAFEITDGTDTVRVSIVDYVSATVVTVQSVGTVPAGLRGVALTGWTFQRDSISGLGHLEGREVAILTDGSVHPLRTVSEAGAVSLAYPAGVVQVGLPYRAHLETLEVNIPGAQTIRDNKKLAQSAGLLLRNSRGVKAGTRLDYLYDLAQREFENYGTPTAALTGYGRIDVSAEWGTDSGHMHIVSDDPLPCEVLALVTKFQASET
jgi:hypothetical protein